ncbi:MAG: nucleotidyltransferase family protein [Treponema sp.]|jgi:CTP:molybdopterin cytidylyltransferase MocA|nr:nucleotidyltransferase family protein [Treponema sp.]
MEPEDADAVLLASGFSRRFGNKDKLLADFRGKALARHTLDLVSGLGCFRGIFFVAAAEGVINLASGLPVTIVRNKHPERGMRESVRLGLEAAGNSGYYMFFPCDQPLLDAGTVMRILEARKPDCIVEPRRGGKPGNPCVFSAAFRAELLSLEEGGRPRDVKARHPEALVPVEIPDPLALADIDDGETLRYISMKGGFYAAE